MKTRTRIPYSIFRIPYSVLRIGLVLWAATLAIQSANAQLVRVAKADEHKKSVVATNVMIATTNSARAFTITAQNSSGGDLWLLVFDRSTNAIPPNGTAPTLSPVKIAAGDTRGWDWTPVGWQFQNGIIVANSTTDRALTNSSANFWINVSYDGKPN